MKAEPFDRIRLLEDIEKTGDVITWQDLSIGESQQAVIEQLSFTRMTPPDRRFDGLWWHHRDYD